MFLKWGRKYTGGLQSETSQNGMVRDSCADTFRATVWKSDVPDPLWHKTSMIEFHKTAELIENKGIVLKPLQVKGNKKNTIDVRTLVGSDINGVFMW